MGIVDQISRVASGPLHRAATGPSQGAGQCEQTSAPDQDAEPKPGLLRDDALHEKFRPVTFQVGHKMFKSTWGTVQNIPVLADFFSLHNAMDPPPFFDRDTESFSLLLNVSRQGNKLPHGLSQAALSSLAMEARFWGSHEIARDIKIVYQPREAVAALKRARVGGSELAQAYSHYAAVLAQTGRHRSLVVRKLDKARAVADDAGRDVPVWEILTLRDADDSEAWAELGKGCLALGWVRRAVTSLGVATTLRPENAGLHLLRAEALLRPDPETMPSLAQRHLRQVIAGTATSVEREQAYRLMSRARRESGHREGALRSIETALLMSAHQPLADLTVKAELQAELEDTSGALATYNVAISDSAASGATHAARGDVCRRMGRYADQETSYLAATELEPDNAEYHRELGDARKAQCDDIGEEQAYTQAARLEPHSAPTLARLGKIRLALKWYEPAETALREAATLEPHNPEVLADLGAARRELGLLLEARDAYLRAAALDGRYLRPLAKLYRDDLQQVSEAVATYDRALRREPRNGYLHNDLGNCHFDLGHFAAAERAYVEALRLVGTISEIEANLADTRAEIEKRRRAELRRRLPT